MAWYSGISNYFSSGNGWSDLFSGVASGVAASSASKDKDKDTKKEYEQALALVGATGTQSLRKSAFEAQLMDLYDQKKSNRKRNAAIDSYGQFSRLDQRVPGFKPSAKAVDPVMPDYKTY